MPHGRIEIDGKFFRYQERKLVEIPTYRCQFCNEESSRPDWVHDCCPLCGRAYGVLLAQDLEE